MTAMLAETATGDPVVVVTEGLARLRNSIPGLGEGEVTERLRAVEAVSRQAHAVMLELVAEAQCRNVAVQAGFGSTQRMLSRVLALTPSDARARVAQAEQVAPRRALNGERLPARCPATAEGLAAGQIGQGQLRVITETVAELPDSTGPAEREWAEAHLAHWAPTLNPTELGRLGTHLLAALDPDGPEPDAEDEPAPSGALRLRDRRRGGISFDGWLDHEHGPAFRELIEQLARPRPAGEDIPDPRGVEERQADALVELCGLARAAEECPTAGAEPPHLTLTMDLNMLIDGIGAAALDVGSWLSAAEARRWACDAKVIPLVLGSQSEPLNVGRAMRTVPIGIRRALTARDRGCARPGCSRPPSACTAHHKVHWVDGGQTSLENCVLLCEYHHREIHNTGWDIVIHPGHVDFIPPAVIDPQRTALRNPLRC